MSKPLSKERHKNACVILHHGTSLAGSIYADCGHAMTSTFRVPRSFLAQAFLFCAAVQAGTYAATPAPLANAVAANATATNVRALFEQY